MTDGLVGEGIRYVLLPEVMLMWDIPKDMSASGPSPIKQILCGSISSTDGVGKGAGYIFDVGGVCLGGTIGLGGGVGLVVCRGDVLTDLGVGVG